MLLLSVCDVSVLWRNGRSYRITRFTLESSKMSAFCVINLTAKFEMGPIDWGSIEWGGFQLPSHAISRKRSEIKLSSQSITNRKSYTGFRIVQKSMTERHWTVKTHIHRVRKKGATLFSTITLASLDGFCNNFCTIKNRNEYSTITCNLLN